MCQVIPKDGYPHQAHAACWCQPTLLDEHPVTGHRRWKHKRTLDGADTIASAPTAEALSERADASLSVVEPRHIPVATS